MRFLFCFVSIACFISVHTLSELETEVADKDLVINHVDVFCWNVLLFKYLGIYVAFAFQISQNWNFK